MIQRRIFNISRWFSQDLTLSSPASRTRWSPSQRTSTLRIAPSRLSSRFYTAEASSQNKLTEQSAKTTQQATGDKPAPQGPDGAKAGEKAGEAANAVVEAKNTEIRELKDKYLRSVADFRNLQEQTKREVQAAKDFALQRFTKELLDTLDNFDRALASTSSPADIGADISSGSPSLSSQPPAETSASAAAKELADLQSGLRMTSQVLHQTLARHGLVALDPAAANDRFDPNRHEATFHAPQQGRDDGTVFLTQQKGYLLNGRVLRAAKVGVVKNS